MATKPDQATDAPAQPKNTPEHIAAANNTPVTDIEPDQELSFRPISTTGETVAVACKHPHGLVLQLCQFTTVSEQVMGGGVRETKLAQRVGMQVRLNGAANRVGEAPKNLTFGGYAITYGVPKDFFDEWLKQNADNEMVIKGLIFALPNATDAKRRGKEQREISGGLEPIDPTKRWKVGPLSNSVVEEMAR